MRRIINQLNVSITTNRGCNLRCEHCYIMPHVFLDPRMMTTDTAKRIFDKVEELYALDSNLQEVEWEVIGGETTLMPFEWWEEMLPWMLDRINEFNKRLKIPGSLNFLTNMMLKDMRYIDLFNEYGDHPAFCLYTSWEPDTKRFGSRNKLFPKFQDNLKKLKLRQLILDIIMTKEVCELGGKWVIDTFVPLGVTDFSCKMLSPYGSGKKFFEKGMTDFASMSKFLEELDIHKPDHVTYTPSEEALSAAYRGTSFQCNGNFYYDLSIEPDGLTHFNANQTAEEAVGASMEIRLEDPNWARKVLYENTPEASGKLNLLHPECEQCEYLRYCNAGWWHYKTNQSLVEEYKTPSGGSVECPGLRKHWDRKKNQLAGSVLDIAKFNHINAVKDIVSRKSKKSVGAEIIHENEMSVESLLNIDSTTQKIFLSPSNIHGKTLLERMMYYDALSVATSIETTSIDAMEDSILDIMIRNHVYGNLPKSTPFTLEQVAHVVRTRPKLTVSGYLQTAIEAVKSLEHEQDHEVENAVDRNTRGLFIDSRNDELFRWLFHNNKICSLVHAVPISLDAQELRYLQSVRSFVQNEKSMAENLNFK